MNQDVERLKLLVIFHYVVAGLAALFACFPIIHVVMGLVMILAPETMHHGHGEPPPAFMGWMFLVLGGTMIVLGWAFAICVFMAAQCLRGRRRHLFCLIMGGVECLFTPFGTVLGIFTILILQRESVKVLFNAQGAPPSPQSPTIPP